MSEHDEKFIYFGRDYFRRLVELIQSARESIRIESYIFNLDHDGLVILKELLRAHARGVKVRLLVDAIGSRDWSKAEFIEAARRGVHFRVFGSPQEIVHSAWRLALGGHFFRALQTLRKLQLRNHRKLAIIDGEVALLGSANIGRDFKDWRETVVELRGPLLKGLRQSFLRCWRFAAHERILDEPRIQSVGIRNNFTTRERREVNLRFLELIRATQRRLWITTAYFHPRPKLLLALFSALARGVDVRILVPLRSDIAWFPWLSRTAFAGLIARGATILEFEGPMLHAKTTLFDHHGIVGSTNMNYRSFIHDLELDVVLESPDALRAMESRFHEDAQSARTLTRRAIREYAPLAYLVSFLLTPLKRWL